MAAVTLFACLSAPNHQVLRRPTPAYLQQRHQSVLRQARPAPASAPPSTPLHRWCNALGCDGVCAEDVCAPDGSTIRNGSGCGMVVDRGTGLTPKQADTLAHELPQQRRKGCGCRRCDARLRPPFHPLELNATTTARSWSYCTGECCAPGARNRTCVHGNSALSRCGIGKCCRGIMCVRTRAQRVPFKALARSARHMHGGP